jgi:hypothetical protein
MYEIPKNGRAVRRAVTREDIEAEQAEAELRDWLLDMIDNDSDVRIAIRNALEGGMRPQRQPRPTTNPRTARGRGR